MIHLKNISLAFGNQKIFDSINHIFSETDRIGLVGRNGTGKSTLLKAVFDPSVLDNGTITISGNASVAYMAQEVVLHSSKSIFDETFSSYKRVGHLYEESVRLEAAIASGDTNALEQYGHITQELALLNIDQARLETRKILIGLGFKEETLINPVSSLSVGWQMRIVLAKLLLQKADFYLFDEPTNHLDIVAKEWFLEFLQHAPFGFLLVCHDKYFLDKVCSSIFELELGKGTWYKGNYEHYMTQKEANLEALHAAYDQQQKTIDKKQQWVDKFKAKANFATRARSVMKALDKIERIEIPPSPKSVNFSFPAMQPSGKMVVEISNLSFAYGDRTIFKNVSFTVERGDRIAIVAPNGAGKTTLFNVICGKLQPKTGAVTYGYNVNSTLFEQEQHKVLDPKKTVLEEVMFHTPQKSEQQIRTFLGSFLFGHEEVQKKTKVLSGGERNRVSMVKVLLQDANLLFLDEPTNHLDIPSKEVLLKALTQYQGTILFVSHDQDFVNQLATKIIELSDSGAFLYHGNYEDFLHQKKFQSSHSKEKIAKAENTTNTHSVVMETKDSHKKELAELERTIKKLEMSIEKIGNNFADLTYGTPEFQKEQDKLNKTQKELDAALKAWEKLLT